MMKRLLSLTVAGIFILGLASVAMAGIPDETLSTATSNAGTLLIVPSGIGPTLLDAGTVISVHVVDANGDDIVGYPFQDIWVDDAGDGSISLCNGGSAADGNTNATGDATISGGIAGGGYTQAGLRVYLAGVAITGSLALSIDLNSCDIDGNLVVGLNDLGEFAQNFSGGLGYGFRADFIPDGVINLADVGEFAIHYDPQGGCP